MDQQGFPETAGGDNCGHHPGLADQSRGDEGAAQAGSGGAKDPSSAPTPLKAMYEELVEEIATASSYHRTLQPQCSRAAVFNRRTLKTAHTVVWEGWRAQSRQPDPLGDRSPGGGRMCLG